MKFFSVALVLASAAASLAIPAPAEVTSVGPILADLSAISSVLFALDRGISSITSKPTDAQVAVSISFLLFPGISTSWYHRPSLRQVST